MLETCMFILMVASVVVLSSCHKNESPTSPSAETGKFVVNSIGPTAQVKEDTATNKLVTEATPSLVDHYENVPGILSDIGLTIKGSCGVNVNIDYVGPEPINEEYRCRCTYKFPDSLIGQDSVKVLRGLTGSFWTNGSGGKFVYVSSFSWNDSLFVLTER